MADRWRIRVPASSANLGPGFDALGLALTAYVEVSATGDPAPETSPAVRAFRTAGGEGPLSVRAQFPAGRGMGYSGAARVAGLLAAAVQHGANLVVARDETLPVAAELEGHADNVAASLFGGVVAAAGGHAVRVPLALEASVVMWVPDRETSTRISRRRLPDQVPFADAAFNVGRVALLVAALAAGDAPAIRAATEDRLHQDQRLALLPETRAAIAASLEAGAWGAWLSGSGPSTAALVEPGRAGRVAAALPGGGRALVLGIDSVGAREARDE